MLMFDSAKELPDKYWPLSVLATDPPRALCICGNEQGQIFIATRGLVMDVLPGVISDAHVIFVPPLRPAVRLPGGYLETGPTITIRTGVIPYLGGLFVIRCGYLPSRNTWAVSGNPFWASDLEVELHHNGPWERTAHAYPDLHLGLWLNGDEDGDEHTG